MKLNQFAIQPAPLSQEIQELQDIHFIEANFLKLSPQQALLQLLLKSFPEFTDNKALEDHLTDFMATSEQNILEYLQQSQISQTAFYNIYWQLLGFEAEVDFSLTNPQQINSQVHYPHFKQKYLTTKDLVHGWYQLLITHNTKGQTFLDELTSRGYFKDLMYDPTTPRPLIFNGKSQAVFDTTKLIHEVVYVESSLDSDHDGQRDLLKVEITRPYESDIKPVPAIYTASPYNQGTNDRDGAAMTHNVNTALQPQTPTTSTLNSAKQTKIPEQLPAPRTIKGTSQQAHMDLGSSFTYSLNDYFLARGFAVVYAAGIGTKDSEGLRTCGDRAETSSTTAVIEWLNQQRTAFTDKVNQIKISAVWCNHNIAMTGRSYLGTLAIAAATTGVAGLKTIIAEAAISSWYDYYRENGLVVAPQGFPGEDADVLAEETFSRQKQAGDYQRIKNRWHQNLQAITQGQDRFTGNYNDFWDQRNYRRHTNQIKADIMLVHGLNDWNVKPKNAYKFWQAIQHQPITKKLILHQGPHIYINNFRSLDYTDIINLWLTHELYNIDNQAENILPNVIIQDNATSETWHSQKNWGSETNKSQKYYLQNQQLTLQSKSSEAHTLSYCDYLAPEKFNYYTQHLPQWQENLTQDNSDLVATRLIFKAPIQTEEKIIDGRPWLNLRLASDQNMGLLSCRLIDYGQQRRLKPRPTLLDKQAIELGYHYQKEDLYEYELNSVPNNFQLISLAHLNLQNRNGLTQIAPIVSGHYYSVKLQLQPTHYRLLPGHQLGLIIYATDMEMTIRGNQAINYSIDPTHSQLIVPYLNLN